jgi:hypothetical protein
MVRSAFLGLALASAALSVSVAGAAAAPTPPRPLTPLGQSQVATSAAGIPPSWHLLTAPGSCAADPFRLGCAPVPVKSVAFPSTARLQALVSVMRSPHPSPDDLAVANAPSVVGMQGGPALAVRTASGPPPAGMPSKTVTPARSVDLRDCTLALYRPSRHKRHAEAESYVYCPPSPPAPEYFFASVTANIVHHSHVYDSAFDPSAGTPFNQPFAIATARHKCGGGRLTRWNNRSSGFVETLDGRAAANMGRRTKRILCRP